MHAGFEVISGKLSESFNCILQPLSHMDAGIFPKDFKGTLCNFSTIKEQ